MEGKFSDLEYLFVKEVLDQHGEYLSNLFVETITKLRLISLEEREHLIESIDYKVSNYGVDPVLTFSFPNYGRFIEINYFKKKSTNTLAAETDNINQTLWNRSNTKKNKDRKKNTRWYSRNLYGSLNRLIGILMYEFTEQERIRLINILQHQNSIL